MCIIERYHPRDHCIDSCSNDFDGLGQTYTCIYY